MIKVGFLYFNEFHYDSRGEKEAATLMSCGYDVKILAYQKRVDADYLDINKPHLKPHIIRFPVGGFKSIPFMGRFFALIFFGLWLFLRSRHFQKIHIHSPFLLPLGYFAKLLNQSGYNKGVLIYDCHELEWDKSGVSDSILSLIRIFERCFISRVDRVITVNEEIRKMYVRRYNIQNVSVIANYPRYTKPKGKSKIRECFAIEEQTIVFVYAGRLTEGRGIEEWMEAISATPYDMELVLIGYGPLEDIVQKRSRDQRSIHFHQAMRQSDLIQFIQAADFGLNTPPLLSESRRQALPNKLFEYLSAGLEVVVNANSNRASFVRNNNCGYIIEDHTVNAINTLLERFAKQRPILSKHVCQDVARKHQWESQESTLLDIYKS